MREILTASVKDIERRTEPNKHYVYCIEVTWNDGTKQNIGRRFTEFFEMHRTLLETFPNEAGKHDSAKRTIPFLPGKVLFKRSDKTKQLTLSRIPHVDDYCRKLVILPKIGQNRIVTSFFEMNSTDIGLSSKRRSSHKEDGSFSTITGPIVVEKYVAVAEYIAQSKSQVSLQVGDEVDVVKKTDSGWWIVTNASGMNGWVPAAYIWKEGGDGKEDLTSQIYDFEGSWYVAIQSYSAKTDAELSFPSGAEILVYEKKLDGWWNGRYNGVSGEVPGSYLEKDTRTNVARNTMPEMPTTLAPKVPYADQNSYEEEQDETYVATCDVTKTMEGEIDLRSGDIVQVFDQSDDNWWLAYVGSREGWVNPHNLRRQSSTTSSFSNVQSPLSNNSLSFSSSVSSSVFSNTSISTSSEPSLRTPFNNNKGRSPIFPRKQLPEAKMGPEMGRKGPQRPPQPIFNKAGGSNQPPSPPRMGKGGVVGDDWLNTYKTPFSTPQISDLEKISYRGDKPAQDLSNLHVASKGKHTIEKRYGKEYVPDLSDFEAEFDKLAMSANPWTTNQPMENEPWFKDIARQAAERALLSEGKEGYFIVRKSQAKDCPYSMTLYHNKTIVNFRIRRRPDNMFATGAYSDGEKTFPSVKEMVDFYSQYSLTVGTDSVRLTGTPGRVVGLTNF